MQAIGMDIERVKARANERIAQHGSGIALVEPADIAVFAAGELNAVEFFLPSSSLTNARNTLRQLAGL